MNATIAGALIGVGGAVTVAVVSSVVTLWTVRWTTMLALRSEQQRRVGDKKIELYVELLADLSNRRAARDRRIRAIDSASDAWPGLDGKDTPDYAPGAWLDFGARIQAFAPELRGVFHSADEANKEASRTYARWGKIMLDLPADHGGGSLPAARAGQDARAKARAAIDEAEHADAALERGISEDLGHTTPLPRR